MKLHGRSTEVQGKMPNILDKVLSHRIKRTIEAAQIRVLADTMLPPATRWIPRVGALQGESQGGDKKGGEV